MKLLIDIGNTSAKIAVADNYNIIFTERINEPWTDVIQRLLKSYPLQRCIISNVAAADPTLDAAFSTCGIPTLWLSDTTDCALRSIPKGYGADRIAADLGAFAQAKGRTILVIDAGTCITYDLIDKDGHILSGVISPGIGLRLKAMHEHTALLPLLSPDFDTPLMGNDTKTHMMSSAIHGTRFEMEGYIRTLAAQYPDLIVFITGGNTIRPDLPDTEIIYEPQLLFKGLSTIHF
ncbi:MAG: type III pantothenate kinase [Bacteroidaceae bacterium]|nr:type III pantothenate kinase [Bacteroidaceae bacterium]